MKYVLVFAAAALLLSGCVNGVVSKNPLSSPKFAATDPRIEGLWRVNGLPGYYDYFAFGSHSYEGNNLFVQFGNPGYLPTSNSTNFFVTRTKRHNYLNLNNDFERDANNAKPTLDQDDYTFLEYHFTNRGELVLSWLSGDLFTKAIKDGRLQGNYSETYLTDSSAHILAFIEVSDPKQIFIPLWKFTRISAP